MADSRRKSTVRKALNFKLQRRANVGKLRGRYLFRAAVRLVIEYSEWIGGDNQDGIGDNVILNVKLAQKKKTTDSDLTIQDRSVLLVSPDKRTSEEVEHIGSLIEDIKAFKKYPEDSRAALAAVCKYQYVPGGRTIVRQGHKAVQLYYVVQGELDIIQDVTDNLTGESETSEQKNIGWLKPGDMFGEIALLHKVPRTATVVSKSSVDLLIIERGAFNECLRHYLMEEWDVLRDAFLNFNYFKGWNEATMRECCILSKIVNYKPNEILLGDGRGMVHYVYFLLSGECRLIEHMLVEKQHQQQEEKADDAKKQYKYKFYAESLQKKDKNPSQRTGRSKKIDLASQDDIGSLMRSMSQTRTEATSIAMQEHASTADELIKLMSSKKDNAHVAMERISVITVTLQDVINQWHEITDTVEMLMKQPSVTSLSDYPKNVQPIFMQICIFYRGACFGLGEQMKNRRIVSITPVNCLLIPRFWLTKHNRANVWERVKTFMNSKYPSDKELFDKFVNNRAWTKYKKSYSEKLVKEGRNLANNTKYYDVPYSIRISENVDDE